MKIQSLLSKITLIFLFAFLLWCGHFFAFMKYQEKHIHEQVIFSHQKLSKFFFINKLSKNNIIKYLDVLDFIEVKNEDKILKNGKIVSSGQPGFDTIFYKKTYYFLVQTPHFDILFKDPTLYKSSKLGFLFFISILLLLIALYVWLIRSLKPLYNLKNDITKFASGNLNINCKSEKKDEIGQVANEFDNAVKQIRRLLDSRQLFLRTVMHEIKTPIAKGKIVSELIDDEKQKSRMNNIFSKLDFLVNDFANIEKILSQNYEINIQKYNLQEIYESSIKLFISDVQNKIELSYDKNKLLDVDIQLFSLVFKNLIDNAFKYSSDGKIKIEQNKNTLIFISNGEKLKYRIENYFEPYHNNTNSKSHGMGLGIYIIKSILDLHKFDFKYEFEENKNIFIIIFHS